MPELGRAASRLPRPRALRARRRRIRGRARAPAACPLGAERARSPRSARRASRRIVLLAALAPERLLLRLRRRAHEPRAADGVHDLRLLGRPGRLAPALAPVLTGFSAAAVALNRRPRARPRSPWVVPVLGLVAGVLRLHARRRLEPVRHAARRRRRRRAQPEPPEPVHDDPPAAALSRLRRADDSVRVRDGRAARAPHRRALDRGHAPLDALRLDLRSGSASCSARTGPTSRSAGAATTRGIPSRTPR